jgi:hypothetical protein
LCPWILGVTDNTRFSETGRSAPSRLGTGVQRSQAYALDDSLDSWCSDPDHYFAGALHAPLLTPNFWSPIRPPSGGSLLLHARAWITRMKCFQAIRPAVYASARKHSTTSFCAGS